MIESFDDPGAKKRAERERVAQQYLDVLDRFQTDSAEIMWDFFTTEDGGIKGGGNDRADFSLIVAFTAASQLNLGNLCAISEENTSEFARLLDNWMLTQASREHNYGQDAIDEIKKLSSNN